MLLVVRLLFKRHIIIAAAPHICTLFVHALGEGLENEKQGVLLGGSVSTPEIGRTGRLGTLAAFVARARRVLMNVPI